MPNPQEIGDSRLPTNDGRSADEGKETAYKLSLQAFQLSQVDSVMARKGQSGNNHRSELSEPASFDLLDMNIPPNALRTIGAASNNAGAKADRAKLNLLLGQDELGLTQLGEAARLHPVYKFEYEYAKNALTYEDSKALYLATSASQLIGSASALKLGFQLSLRAPARPQKAGG